MTKIDTDFDSWFEALQLSLFERNINYRDREAVRDDYDAGLDVYVVADGIALEYE